MIKRVNIKKMLSSSLLWKDNCSFIKENDLKLTSKIRKNPKFSNCQCFDAGFVKLMTDFVDRKGTRGQQGTTLLYSRLSRKVNCGFQVENVSNWHRI